MLTLQKQQISLDWCPAIFAQTASPVERRGSGPFGLIVASIVGVLVWLFFILFYALFWSTHFTLFQNTVVFIASLAITVLLIGLMWLIFGARRFRSWSWNNW